MSTAPRPTKAVRRDEARAAALRLKEEQERKARRQRTIAIAALVGGLALLAVIVTVILAQGQSKDIDTSAAPATALENGGIPVGPDGVAGTTEGAADDAVTVTVYSDFMCPICAQFEEVNAADLDALRKSGDVVVEYHPVSILDRAAAGSRYSTRAASAAATVADQDPEHFLPFMNDLFKNQPKENTTGLTDEEMAAIAVDAGVPQEVADTFADHAFEGWAAAATEQASKDLGNFGTPTILINGKNLGDDLEVDWRVPGALKTAIEAEQG
jgi:protein-disulfide isomerase